jgi:hypothetical protein
MTGLTDWLTDPDPGSRAQARLGQAWLAWLRLRRNPLAMTGLLIVIEVPHPALGRKGHFPAVLIAGIVVRTHHESISDVPEGLGPAQ